MDDLIGRTLQGPLRALRIERTIATTPSLDATLPIDMTSPLAGPTTLRLPGADDDALSRTLVLPETAVTAPARPAPSTSVGRSGRPTPVPVHSLARSSSRPPPPSLLAKAQRSSLLALCAACLTLGFVIGLLLVFPILR